MDPVPAVTSPLAATVNLLSAYLANEPNYSIWRTTLLLLSDQITSTNYDRLLFVACDNQTCIIRGLQSPQAWATQAPESFLSQILALPRGWPSSSVGLHQCETLGVDTYTNTIISVYVRASPTSFIFPSNGEGHAQAGEAVATCNQARHIGHTGSVFVLRKRFLDVAGQLGTSLQTAMCCLAPELGYFRVWLGTAGLADLASQPGNYTLLAPSNAAFDALARAAGVATEELVRNPGFAYMAGYHVLCGFYGPLFETLQPPELVVSSDGFPLSFKRVAQHGHAGTTYQHYVNFAKIDLQLSQETNNGYLYVLDSVLSHGSSGPAPCL